MIHEFALDPEIVAKWDRKEILTHISSVMGLGTPRILNAGPTPAEWRAQVVKLAPSSLSDVARARLVALIQRLTEVTSMRTPAPPTDRWIDFVKQEHARVPFAGVIAQSPWETGIHPEDVIWDRQPPWEVAPTAVVKREATAYSELLAPMLRVARTLAIVDPYFSATNPRFVGSLDSLLTQALARRANEAAAIAVTVLTRSDCSATLYQKLSERIPMNLRVRFARYEGSGDEPHNRYVLCELGGVMIGAGLDEKFAATDDVSVLSRENFALRNRQYVQRNDGFSFEDLTTVVGAKRLGAVSSTRGPSSQHRRR